MVLEVGTRWVAYGKVRPSPFYLGTTFILCAPRQAVVHLCATLTGAEVPHDTPQRDRPPPCPILRNYADCDFYQSVFGRIHVYVTCYAFPIVDQLAEARTTPRFGDILRVGLLELTQQRKSAWILYCWWSATAYNSCG